MPAHLECDGCGAEIVDFGWRAYPAILDGTSLNGHILKEGEDPQRVGLPVDLCTKCVVTAHPKQEIADAGHDKSG